MISSSKKRNSRASIFGGTKSKEFVAGSWPSEGIEMEGNRILVSFTALYRTRVQRKVESRRVYLIPPLRGRTIPVVDPLTPRFTLASPVVPFTPPLDPLWPPPSPSRATGNVVGASWRYSNHEWGPRVFLPFSLCLPLARCWFGSMPPWIPRVPVFSTCCPRETRLDTRDDSISRVSRYEGCSRWDFEVANRNWILEIILNIARNVAIKL